ncbi:hypothetical protein Tco_1279772 [Tanacetum coccineum]
MRIHHSKANTPRGAPFDETRAEVIYKLAVQPSPLNSSITIEAWSFPILHNQWGHPGREDTPPSGFSTLTPLPSPNMGELPPIIASTFIVKSPKKTPLTNRASTSSNPDLISPAFVEANYEVLISLLRDARRYVHNEDLHTKLDYYSEDYDEEREMEPRPILRTEMGAGLKGNPMARPSEQRVENGGSHGGNHPSLLAAHLGRSENGQPLQSTLTSGYGGNQPSTNSGGISLLMIKMPSHVGSYDAKGDPNNYLHLFEGAIYMHKWTMLVACHIFTYTLKDSARIWRNRQEESSIVNYENLKGKFWSHFSQEKKFTKTHLAVHNIKQKDGESTRAFVTRYTNNTLQILRLHEEQPKEVATNRAPSDYKEGLDKFSKGFSWDNNKGKKKNQDMFSPYKGSNHGLHDHVTCPSIVISTKITGHKTNQYRELRHQIEEAVKLGKLAHLVKGMKKGKAKASDTQLGE